MTHDPLHTAQAPKGYGYLLNSLRRKLSKKRHKSGAFLSPLVTCLLSLVTAFSTLRLSTAPDFLLRAKRRAELEGPAVAMEALFGVFVPADRRGQG
jgi:hypothetical protein